MLFRPNKDQAAPPKIIKACSYKNFDQAKFSKDIMVAHWSVCEIFDNLVDCYWARALPRDQG